MAFDPTQIAVAFFTALPPTILAWAALRSSKHNGRRAVRIEAKQDTLHDGMKTALEAANKKADHAEGVADERAAGIVAVGVIEAARVVSHESGVQEERARKSE